MIGFLRSDWRKLRQRWMPRILILILLAIVVLVFLGISSRARFRSDLVMPGGLIVALSLGAAFAAFIWPILAGSWSGNEYGWGTIRMALTKEPNRIAFSLSGLIVVLITVGVGLILVLIVGAIASSVVSAATHAVAATPPPGANATNVIIKMFFGAWYASAFYVVLAYAAGAIFRSPAAGIGIGIGFAVAQSAVSGIFGALGDPWKIFALHFPDAYTTALTSRLANELVVRGPLARVAPHAASIQVSIFALAIYIAILVGLMLAVVQRRDITS